MKTLLTAFIFILCLSAQSQDLSGFYSGTLYNDTTGLTQNYEIALSEYRGKITGYSYTTFVINDTFYYGIRRIKASRQGKNLVVEDDKLIVNNFPAPPTRGVRKIVVFPLEGDSIVSLSGRWQTNRTKQYYPITGDMKLQRDEGKSQSALFSHLRELKLADNSGNIFTDPKTEDVAIKEAAKVEKQERSQPVAKVEKRPKEPIARVEKKQSQVAPSDNIKKPATENKNPDIKPALVATESVLERKTNIIQTVGIISDSIMLSLYDNGVVDGDVVSVYLDDRLIIEKVKITEKAFRQTIALPAGARSAKLTLVADNLGSLPPNTGLLIVQDGNTRHNVHFSADMKTNAGIIFEKK